MYDKTPKEQAKKNLEKLIPYLDQPSEEVVKVFPNLLQVWLDIANHLFIPPGRAKIDQIWPHQYINGKSVIGSTQPYYYVVICAFLEKNKPSLYTPLPSSIKNYFERWSETNRDITALFSSPSLIKASVTEEIRKLPVLESKDEVKEVVGFFAAIKGSKRDAALGDETEERERSLKKQSKKVKKALSISAEYFLAPDLEVIFPDEATQQSLNYL